MINIVFASDNNYAQILKISIQSLLFNNKNVPMNIFILDNGINEKNHYELIEIINKFNNIHLDFIFMKNIKENFDSISSNDMKNLNKLTMYSRLFLASVLPNNIEKILYLDCDSLILNSIDDLYKTNIEDYMCAGVLDPIPIYFKKVIELANDDFYINTGVLLINLKKWREINIEKTFINFLKSHENEYIHNDQGVINGVLKNQMLILNPKYNLLSNFHGKTYEIGLKWSGVTYDYYSKPIVEKAITNPTFIHFSGSSLERPWLNPNNYYRKIYETYAKMANCCDVFQKPKNVNIIRKIYIGALNHKITFKLLNIIPNSIALRFVNFIIKNQVKRKNNLN